MMNQLGGIGNIGTNPAMQGNNLRQMVEQFGTQQLKDMVKNNNMSDDQLAKYLMQHPEELQSGEGAMGPGGPGAPGGMATGAADSSGAASASATGNAAAAAAADQTELTDESSGDCYDENDEIPTDECMAQGQMCGMDDVSGADRCKPYTQQCLGETKAIKKVLEKVQQADSGNPHIGGDISQVDEIVEDLRSKLKKGKKAADDNFSNAESAEACQRECDDKVKEAVDIASDNGLEIEVSEKRAEQLGGGQMGGGQQGAGGAQQGGKPGAGQNQQAQQVQQQQQQTKDAAKANEQQDIGGPGGGEDAGQKPFKIKSEPEEVDKELGLDEVQNHPQLAQALEASLDNTIAQQQAAGQTGEGTAQEAPTLDLGATQEGSPVHQQLGAVGQGPGAGQGAGGAQGPHAGPSAAYQQQATGGQTGGGGVQSIGGGGGMKAGGGAAGLNAPTASGLAEKMKMAGVDSNKKFNVKMKVYQPGQAIQVVRDGDGGGGGKMKVGKDMKGATMNVKPPPLAAVDEATGQVHRIGDIQAMDGGAGGVFNAKVKEGQPIMNMEGASNTIQGDVALPGTKTEEAKPEAELK